MRVLITALAFLLLAAPLQAGLGPQTRTFNCDGHSTCAYQSTNATQYGPNLVPSKGYSNNSPLQWAARFLGQQITFDIDQGYVDANWNGLHKLVVADQGSGCVTPTVTFNPPYCGLAPTFGTPVLSAGKLVSVPITNAGWGCNGGGSVTVTGCTVAPKVYAVIGGTGNFGVPGEGTAGLLARIGDMTGSSISSFLHQDGANDRNQSVTPAQTFTNLQTQFAAYAAGGKVLYDQLEGPINTSGCGAGCLFNANQYREILQTNALRKSWAQDTQPSFGNVWPVVTFDPTAAETDPASATGAALPSLRDAYGVHATPPSGIIQGQLLADLIRPSLGLNAKGNTTNQLDVYNATYNPKGFVSANPFMASNGGWNPVATGCSGSPASGWGLQKDSGTATGTCSIAVTANQMVFTASLGSGTAAQYYAIYADDTPANLNLTSADSVFAQCDVEVSNGRKINWLELDIVPFNSSWQGLFELFDGDGGGVNIPYPDTGTIGSLDGKPMTFRTPPYPLSQGGSFSSIALMRIVLHVGFDASGGAASATATVKVSNCGIKKI